MKKQETFTQRYCDNCKKKIDRNEIKYECEGCEYDVCDKCFDKKAKLYLKSQDMTQDSIYVVCNKCDHKPPTDKVKEFVDFFKAIGKIGEQELARSKEYGEMIDKYRKDNMPK